MKDSRIGVMGLVTILAVLGMKWAGMSELNSQRWLALCLVPAYSRAGMLVGMRVLPYGRPEGGTGLGFCDPGLPLKTYWVLPLLVVLSLFLGWQSLVVNGLFVLTTTALLWFYARKIGCITGDTLGAMNEVLEAVLFLGLAV
jgi:adenosylcobinamide-GDP ribazoletransferase